MASFEEAYGMTIDEHIEQLKREGKWTKCHDFESEMNLICLRCDKDFEPAVKEIREEWGKTDDIT
ncbi:hypothetical protein LCGC14_2107570 [marine sediment metagenome]|uniref:Uncharacterized protein n=1 Tax=marine sediment metagenome TaxID=412755 RepID=A0A0F9E882_9ZZZZ